MTRARGGQHLVFDAEVVDGLVYAYRAREALQLPDGDRDRRSATRSTAPPAARSGAIPTIRLNQVNWYALMYAADATVTGDNTLLKRDMSLQLRALLRRRRAAAPRARATSAPACASTTCRTRALNARKNVDSAEYANIVLTFTRFYDQARRAGMPALPGSASASCTQWITRAISGYWTHAGYMNWDSGLGFNRWHQAKKFGLTQEALVGLASSDSLLPGTQWGRWAKTMLDNGFDFYERLAERSPDGLAGRRAVRRPRRSRRAPAARASPWRA